MLHRAGERDEEQPDAVRRPPPRSPTGSTTITPSNSRPLASGAGTTTIGRSGSTSPGSASVTPRASSAARSSVDAFGHRDHRHRREIADQRDRVVGDLVDEVAGVDAVQVGRVAVGAHRT